MDNGPCRLVGQIQHYAWGGHEFIPELLGLNPEPQTTYAEYWLGAHKKAPSKIVLQDGKTVPLDAFIAQDPTGTLGQRAAVRYGRLPYLFKVLDVEKPLSIQVHPNKSQAEAGFARESALGIPLDAPERNYKDDNHKPELMVALSDFWLLHGFLPKARLLDVLQQVPEFHVLRTVFENQGHAGLYRHVMSMAAEEAAAILGPLVQRIRSKGQSGGSEKSSAEYWVARVVADSDAAQCDRGLFSIYFFNLVHLRPGQAIFQDAGIPHAYLQGQNIEVMANSDNVLRGGLTPKHVDMPELLSTVRFVGISPRVTEGTPVGSPVESLFEAPIQDFRLSRIHLGMGEPYANLTRSIEIVLSMAGEAAIECGGQHISLNQGQSAVLFSESAYKMQALSDEAVLFRVSLP